MESYHVKKWPVVSKRMCIISNCVHTSRERTIFNGCKKEFDPNGIRITLRLPDRMSWAVTKKIDHNMPGTQAAWIINVKLLKKGRRFIGMCDVHPQTVHLIVIKWNFTPYWLHWYLFLLIFLWTTENTMFSVHKKIMDSEQLIKHKHI